MPARVNPVTAWSPAGGFRVSAIAATSPPSAHRELIVLGRARAALTTIATVPTDGRHAWQPVCSVWPVQVRWPLEPTGFRAGVPATAACASRATIGISSVASKARRSVGAGPSHDVDAVSGGAQGNSRDSNGAAVPSVAHWSPTSARTTSKVRCKDCDRAMDRQRSASSSPMPWFFSIPSITEQDLTSDNDRLTRLQVEVGAVNRFTRFHANDTIDDDAVLGDDRGVRSNYQSFACGDQNLFWFTRIVGLCGAALKHHKEPG